MPEKLKATIVPGPVAALCLVLLPLPLRADPPGVEFFTGLYERVGRDEAGSFLNDLVRIDPKGSELVLSDCPDPAAADPVIFHFESIFETDNFLAGQWGTTELWCQFNNDGQNYAILNCGTDGGARFTLWPQGSGPGCTSE